MNPKVLKREKRVSNYTNSTIDSRKGSSKELIPIMEESKQQQKYTGSKRPAWLGV